LKLDVPRQPSGVIFKGRNTKEYFHPWRCVQVYSENVDNQLTSNNASQLRMILNAADHIQDEFQSVLKQVRCRGFWSTRF